MTTSPTTKSVEDVRHYWDARPCNVRHSRMPVGSVEYFNEVEARKYFVERHIPGFEKIQLLRRAAGEEVEFITIMSFDSLAAVRQFAGEEYELAVVPPKARAVLAHFDERSQHYELVEERSKT